MSYPKSAYPPSVYLSLSDPDMQEFEQYFHTTNIIDIVNTDTMTHGVPNLLPFVTTYEASEPRRLYGAEALAFLRAYLQHVAANPRDDAILTPDEMQ